MPGCHGDEPIDVRTFPGSKQLDSGRSTGQPETFHLDSGQCLSFIQAFSGVPWLTGSFSIIAVVKQLVSSFSVLPRFSKGQGAI